MTNQLSFLASGAVQAAFHPLTYTKVLMQLGYEPRPPKLGTSLFGSNVLVSANILEYITDIKRSDGFAGLYRGLSYRIVGAFASTAAQQYVLEALCRRDGSSKAGGANKKRKNGGDEIEYDKDTGEEIITWDDVMDLAKSTRRDIYSKVCGIIVGQPLQVIAVRMMAQYIGGETSYDCYTCGFVEIYQSEGIRGFFAGLVPKLLCEVSCIVLTNVVTFLLEKIVVEDGDLRRLTKPLVSVFIGSLMYPLQVVSTVMSVQGSGLKAAAVMVDGGTPPYASWVHCYWDMRQKKLLKRGASMFWRYQPIRIREF